ncbi:MAG: acyltransferase [Thermoleophilia bacterium]
MRVFHTPCQIMAGVRIANRKNFDAGERSALYRLCQIINDDGWFSLGSESHLGAFCYVNVTHGKVTIGDHVAIGPGTRIIAYSNHYERGKKITDVHVQEDVAIGNNVLIGANCTILPGSAIGDNVVVGAGSVVKGTLENNSIYAGVPCGKINGDWYE